MSALSLSFQGPSREFNSHKKKRLNHAAVRFGDPFPERLQENKDCVPTPPNLTDILIKRADIKSGMAVLEPHAGTGNIAKVLRQIPGIKLSVGEFDEGLRNNLKEKSYNVVSGDFLKHNGQYDRIIMNPPYSKKQSVAHVKHGYEQLKTGGKLVAIIPDYVFSQERFKPFMSWLKESPVGVGSERLNRDEFRNDESTARIKTRILIINKPAKNAKSQKKGKRIRFEGLAVPVKEVPQLNLIA